MKIPFRKYHLIQLLEEYDRSDWPIDVSINLYFRAHKALGSKDRHEIAETAISMIRWLGLIEEHEDWASRIDGFEKIQPDLDQVIDKFGNQYPLHKCVSFPNDLFQLFVEHFGQEKAIEICLTSNQPAPTVVRVNPLKISRDDLLKLWKEKGYPVKPCELSENGIVFEKRMNFFHLDEFKNGFFEVQDEGSQLLANLVAAKPGDQVLDYCAGAGGKTLAFAPFMQGQGQIYLHDIRTKILSEAKKRLRRAGIQNAQFIDYDSPKLRKLKKKMDWVLVDTPCSGTGTIRRNPDMKWRFTQAMLDNLIRDQRVIFEKALSFVKPGGHIVYATCSLLKQENGEQAEYFLKTHSLELVGQPFESFPCPGEMDGFYGMVFHKK
ncbi:MAG: Ribosomal RNA small subunit methyltransferase B [Chlamydiae bacterium]|nr:Ribosomal RNA small subunit methyltransferase B [Chlamydiota bacterium]